jgi:hypothetical protein
MEPRCDDGTLPENCQLRTWYDYLVDASARSHKPIKYNHAAKDQLKNAGFIDIEEKIIRAPLNIWSNDPHQKEIGGWYNLGLTEGVEALSLALFYRMFHWNVDQHIRPLIESVKGELAKPKIHAYNNMWV